MKTSLYILLAALLTIALVACGAPAAATTPPPITGSTLIATAPAPAADTPAPAAVQFADPALEAMIRGAMGRPEGDITAAAAEAVTSLNLSNELRQYVSDETPITDISGLEYFVNLENLDLGFHAVTDLSPLADLQKITLLSLEGSPVADLSPLAGLTGLKALNLSGCAAQDAGPLAGLVNLEYLKLDNTTVTDVSPLASLSGLRHLYLENSLVNDYSPLTALYPNLEGRDFIMASTLEELGFSMNDASHQAFYDSDTASVTINHTRWGAPPMEWDANIIRVSLYLEGDTKLAVGFYGDIDAYVIQMYKDGEMVINYIYSAADDSPSVGAEDRERTEQTLRATLGDADAEDILLVPVSMFNDTIQNTFHMTADALYAFPYEPPTLTSLGFFPDEANAVWRYEQRGERDVNLEIHRPEWGEKDYDLLFFTPLSDEYRIVVTYHADKRSFVAGIDDNNGGGADFEYFIDTGEHVDGWCSVKDMKVEEYFANAFNDPRITDIYRHSVDLVEQYIQDTFGMTLEELFVLPVGE